MSHDARRKILDRRATFVAAAIASMTACERKPGISPEPCLSAPPITVSDTGTTDAGATEDTSGSSEAPPLPCLSPMPPDTGVAPTPTAQDAGPKPHPCLKVAPSEPL